VPPVLAGGVACGTLDLAFAFIFYGAEYGIKPMRIAQSIAAGLLGPRAFEGGVGAAVFGVVLHYNNALLIAFAFCATAAFWSWLTRWALWTGLVYGAVVYFVMNWVVLPLSAFPMRSYPPPVEYPALIAHMFLVGLPVALIARRWLGRGYRTRRM